MANANIEAFILEYGDRPLPQQAILLRAVADYFDSFPADAFRRDGYKDASTFATITVSEGDSGATDETSDGDFLLTLPPSGSSAPARIPVAAIPSRATAEQREQRGQVLQNNISSVLIDRCACR